MTESGVKKGKYPDISCKEKLELYHILGEGSGVVLQHKDTADARQMRNKD